MSEEAKKEKLDNVLAKGSPVMEATVIIRNKKTGDVVNEVHLDVITNLQQNREIKQYPVRSKPGRRVFLPGDTTYHIEGVAHMAAEDLIEYFNGSLCPSMNDILEDKLEGVDLGDGTMFEADADRPFAKAKPEMFGMDKDEFEKKVGHLPVAMKDEDSE